MSDQDEYRAVARARDNEQHPTMPARSPRTNDPPHHAGQSSRPIQDSVSGQQDMPRPRLASAHTAAYSDVHRKEFVMRAQETTIVSWIDTHEGLSMEGSSL